MAKLLIVPVFAAQFLFFGYIALHRFVDGDEGFYLLASRLVLMHKVPYVDFFYTQTPLLPYIYAAFLKCFGVTWTSARLCAAMFSALIGTAIFVDVADHCRRSWIGLAAVGLYSVSTFVFGWFPVAKTYSLSVFLLFAAYLLVSRIEDRYPRWRLAACGVALGLTVGVRSYLVLLVPLFAWWVWKNCQATARIASIFWLLAGFTGGLAPTLWLLLMSPDAFLFNNLGYHAIRTDAGLVGAWGEKAVLGLMLLLDRTSGNVFQNGIPLITGGGLVSLMPKRRYAPRLAFQIGLLLGVISLLPTPAYIQYFSICVPFLLASAVCLAYDVVNSLETRSLRAVGITACVAFSLVYVLTSPADFDRYLRTGDGVPGPKWAADRNDWRLQQVVEVSRAVDQFTDANDIVASFAPAYVFQTRTVPLQGLESDFALPVSEKLTPEQRAKYHIMSMEELRSDIAAHKPRVVVLRKQIAAKVSSESWQKYVVLEDNFRDTLPGLGYRQVRSIGNTALYADCKVTLCPQQSASVH